MTPAELAALHALSFDTAPRPWTAAEFAEFLDDPTVALCAVPNGFGLLRIAGPEAEILTNRQMWKEVVILEQDRHRARGRAKIRQILSLPQNPTR